MKARGILPALHASLHYFPSPRHLTLSSICPSKASLCNPLFHSRSHNMSNVAALIPAAKAPLQVKEAQTYTPSPHELLVRNKVIAFNPVESKIAKLALIPIPYPAILGLSFGGTVEAVGSEVSHFQVGDKIAVRKQITQIGLEYGDYQRYALAGDETASKVPEGIDLTEATALVGNLTTVAGLFGVRVGLDRPKVNGSAATR